MHTQGVSSACQGEIQIKGSPPLPSLVRPSVAAPSVAAHAPPWKAESARRHYRQSAPTELTHLSSAKPSRPRNNFVKRMFPPY